MIELFDKKKRTFALIDASNMFYRARHATRAVDLFTKIGMSYHIFFSAIAKACREFGADHVVICLDGKPWRERIYPQYKGKRKADRLLMSKTEQQDEADMKEAFTELQQFFINDTNCTVLFHENIEADDFVARWIHYHDDANHVIISTDSDFHQLIRPNVVQYNGVTTTIYTTHGVYDEKMRKIKDKKTGEYLSVEDPEWTLFLKCIRGDSSDSIFSALPRASLKGTKNRVGIIDAFNDRNDRGYNWNNFMLQRWLDHEGVEHRVLEDYERNRDLIDLSRLPDDIVDIIDGVIVEAVQRKSTEQVGIRFMRFCGKHELNKLAEHAQQHGTYLNNKYNG